MIVHCLYSLAYIHKVIYNILNAGRTLKTYKYTRVCSLKIILVKLLKYVIDHFNYENGLEQKTTIVSERQSK